MQKECNTNRDNKKKEDNLKSVVLFARASLECCFESKGGLNVMDVRR